MNWKTFFNPSQMHKEYYILDSINHDAVITQRQIAKELGIAVSIVNQYLVKLEEEKKIERRYISKRTVLYIITNTGKERLLELKIRYYKAIQDLYKVTQHDVSYFFQKLKEQKVGKVFCYGAGEVAQTILLLMRGIKDNPVEIMGIIDDDIDKQNTVIGEYNVYSYECLTRIRHDAVVVLGTSSKQNILDQLDKIKYPKERTFCYFD